MGPAPPSQGYRLRRPRVGNPPENARTLVPRSSMSRNSSRNSSAAMRSSSYSGLSPRSTGRGACRFLGWPPLPRVFPFVRVATTLPAFGTAFLVAA